MTFKIYLKKKANKKYSVYIQAIHNRKVKYIKNGVSIGENQINKKGEIKDKEIKNSIEAQIRIYEQKVCKLGVKANSMTCDEIVTYIQKEDEREVQAERLDFFEFAYNQ